MSTLSKKNWNSVWKKNLYCRWCSWRKRTSLLCTTKTYRKRGWMGNVFIRIILKIEQQGFETHILFPKEKTTPVPFFDRQWQKNGTQATSNAAGPKFPFREIDEDVKGNFWSWSLPKWKIKTRNLRLIFPYSERPKHSPMAWMIAP